MEDRHTHIYFEDRTAGAYLTQARRGLFNCGNPGMLYGTWREPPNMEVEDRMAQHLRALDRQLDWARTSTLFSALAGEAYINGFLVEKLTTAADYEAVERLPTLEKYVLGTQLAVGKRLFDRGTEPGQTLGALFKLRHDLVHPKMRPIRMDRGTLMDERFEDFNAEAAARFLVSVAEAARTLVGHASRREDSIISSVLSERDRFLALGTLLRRELPDARKKSSGAPWLAALGADVAANERARVDIPEDQQRPEAAPRIRRTIKRDPLQPPATVPLEPAAMLEYLASLPGTATSAMRYYPGD